MSIGPSSPQVLAGRWGRPQFQRSQVALGRPVLHRLGAFAVALTVALSALTVTPVLGAAGPVQTTNQLQQASVPRMVAQDGPQDALDGGYLPPNKQVVVPSIELGLTQQRPIPLGVTCSCAIDRTGLISQFDLTVIDVVQDAYGMVQQLNRFNRPPRPGARYVAVYVGQQYIAGPESQAYTISEADWKATATDRRLSDTAQLLRLEPEYRPRADVYATNYVNGWLYYELPLDRPAFLVWKYNFVGERGIWFALQ